MVVILEVVEVPATLQSPIEVSFVIFCGFVVILQRVLLLFLRCWPM